MEPQVTTFRKTYCKYRYANAGCKQEITVHTYIRKEFELGLKKAGWAYLDGWVCPYCAELITGISHDN